MIDKATVEKIKEAADIVEVVSDYVHLVKRGANFMGLCPFHNERTPSFSVNRKRNICYCFSCHKGGSPVNFVMEKEGISYHDALIHLANKYGIKVEEKELSAEERAAITEREEMLVANEWTMKQMQGALTDTEEGQNVGLQYFYQRGITQEAIKAFRLGYALDDGFQLVSAAKTAGIDINILKKTGVVGTSQSGRDYSRFRGRVIFPILNSSGKVIAFGGRDLKGGPAKYINSPESSVYHKSNELYGIFQAKNEIVRQDRCFLVEGYMDVIGMWQAGIKNTVASSGTALTDGQIALIHRFTNKITLVYDGDNAGIKAALRGIDMLLSHKMDVSVLLLPDGDDPDSFARKHTPEEFIEYVKTHTTDIIRFKAQVVLGEAGDDPQKRTQAIMSMVETMAVIPNDVERNVYISECARIFAMDENILANAVAKARNNLLLSLSKQQRLKEFDRSPEGHSLQNTNAVAGNTNVPGSDTPNTQTTQDSTLGQPQSANTSTSSGMTLTQPRAENPITSGITLQAQTANPLQPLELQLIQNCIRFGFMEFCESAFEDKAGQRINVAEFVDEELQFDGIVLTTPLYERTLRLLLSMRGEFDIRYRELADTLKQTAEQNKSEDFRKLSLETSSIQEIQRKEREITQSYDEWIESELKDFSRHYAGDQLASHEDNEIRHLANSVVNERYTLSNIFIRAGHVKSSNDDPEIMVPRAVVELKCEILAQKIKKITTELRDISGVNSNLSEEEASQRAEELMLEMNVLLKMRSEVAKNIGDRIISPRR